MSMTTSHRIPKRHRAKKTQSQKIDKTKEKLELTKQIESLNFKRANAKSFILNEAALSLIASKQKDLASAKEHFTKVSEQGKRNKEELDTLSKHAYDEALHKPTKDFWS